MRNGGKYFFLLLSSTEAHSSDTLSFISSEFTLQQENKPKLFNEFCKSRYWTPSSEDADITAFIIEQKPVNFRFLLPMVPNLTLILMFTDESCVPVFLQVPRVFIGEQCIGGGSEVSALHRSGKLEAMLTSIEALQWPASDLQVQNPYSHLCCWGSSASPVCVFLICSCLGLAEPHTHKNRCFLSH